MNQLRLPRMRSASRGFGAILVCAGLGLCTFGGFAGIAKAQEGDTGSAVLPTDFCIVYESLERLAHGQGLSLERTGGNWGCTGGEHADRLKERLAIVSDQEKLPFVEKGDAYVYVAEIGSESDKRRRDRLRIVKLDPDTGQITPPTGLNLGGLKILSVGFTFEMKDARRQKLCNVWITREFSEKGIRVTMKTDAQSGLAFCREFMAALESRIKLAAKLKAARENRRPAANSPSNGMDSNAKEPTPKPRSVASIRRAFQSIRRILQSV
jgi:hypothetical protein